MYSVMNRKEPSVYQETTLRWIYLIIILMYILQNAQTAFDQTYFELEFHFWFILDTNLKFVAFSSEINDNLNLDQKCEKCIELSFWA